MLSAADDFTTFGTSHVVVLIVFVIGVVAAIWVGKAQRGTPAATATGKAVAVLIPVVTIPLQVLQFLPAEWNFDTSLPLQLCDLAWIAAVIALWTHRRWAVALVYYWGITLTTQGIITPDLAENFPQPRFLMFWAMHMLVVWSAFYLSFGLRLTPTWREFRSTVAITFVWAVGVVSFNFATGANYGYLNGKPGRASALDLLGPWPLYVVVEVALILAVWALMTWPWVRVDARRQSHSPNAYGSRENR
ncbi:MAG: TIGR02206 family membrane protein [Nocardioidaceae bacterium]